MEILDTGNAACATAVRLATPDVIAAYPITPQTSVVEKLAAYINEGSLNCQFIPVESEHSALSAIAAASTAGARVFTATSSQGLLYMHEILHYAAGGRLAMVMANVNRAINAPWCLYVDHQDSVSQRDTGWIQLYAANNQEIHDFILLAYRVTEEVNIPVMVCYDGFILSHSMAPFEIIEKDVIEAFLPPFEPAWQLHPDVSRDTYAAVTPANLYSGFRKKLTDDLMKSTSVIESRGAELDSLTGHSSCSLIEPYRTEGAEYFILSMGSMGTEAELAVDLLRERGIKAAGLRLKMFRPFPKETLSKLLPEGSKLIVLDRNHAYGTGGGALYCDARSALYDRRDGILIGGREVGIGGTELTARFLVDTVLEVIDELKEVQ